MLIIDANYVLRWFLNDNVDQAKIVDNLLKTSQRGSIVLDKVTIAEITYVLRSQGYDHSQIFNLLEELNYYPSMQTFNEIDRTALELYRDTSLDFEDCVMLAFHKIKGYSVGTFDKEILKLTS